MSDVFPSDSRHRGEVQLRFTQPVFELAAKANYWAVAMECQRLDTPHLLLGLLDTRGCSALIMFKDLDVDIESLRQVFTSGPFRGVEKESQKLEQTREAKRVVQDAVRIARKLQRAYVGSEHIGFGLAQDGQPTSDPLRRHGLSIDRILRWLQEEHTREPYVRKG